MNLKQKSGWSFYLTSVFIGGLSSWHGVFPTTVVAQVSTGTGVPIVEETGESLSTLSKRGEHFEALRKYYEGKDFVFSLTDTIFAARSAWALGLPQQAREIWDQVFANSALANPERVREILARSIMELQEGNYETSRSLAEEAVYDLESSDARSQLFLVIAESLNDQGTLKRAESFYQKAALEGSKSSRGEAQFLLGQCQLKQGLAEQARYSFTAVPTESSFAPGALRKLSEIDLQEKEYESVLTWIEEGEERYPSEFDEASIYHAKITALLELGRFDQAQQALEKLRSRYSENNSWFILAHAMYLSKELQGFPLDEQKEELREENRVQRKGVEN